MIKNVVSYKELLEIFFSTHDPTKLNRQGNDVGTQATVPKSFIPAS